MITVIAIIFWIWLMSVVLYMLAIMPRMLKRADRRPFLGILYAHRGLHDNNTDAPENSMKAFAKAVEAGYGIEMDVQLSKDGIPVVFHDFTLDRMCGRKGRVCEYTFEELQELRLADSQERIPKFEDVLKLVDGKVPLIVEYKLAGNNTNVCVAGNDLLNRYEGKYCIESFHPFALLWYRKHNKKIMRGQLSYSFKEEKGYKRSLIEMMLANLLFNFISKPDFIAYDHRDYRNKARGICRYVYGGLAVAWTIKNQEELDARREDFDLFIFDSFIPGKEKV